MTLPTPKRGQLTPFICAFSPSSLTSLRSFLCKLPSVSFMLGVSFYGFLSVCTQASIFLSVPKNNFSPASVAPGCTLMLPFLLYWMSPLPPHHPFLKPPQSWPLLYHPASHKISSDHSLVTSMPISHRRQCFCGFDRLFGGAQHPWLLSPSSFFSASIVNFSCSTSHLNPKINSQSCFLLSIYTLFESQYFLCTTYSWHSLFTTPKYIYGKVTFYCTREMITKQTSREGSSGRTSWHHDIWARHRW